MRSVKNSTFFFFNDTATTEIYTLSLHDALPIWKSTCWVAPAAWTVLPAGTSTSGRWSQRSEEHTSELQSLTNLLCHLLLQKRRGKTTCAMARGRDRRTRTLVPMGPQS